MKQPRDCKDCRHRRNPGRDHDDHRPGDTFWCGHNDAERPIYYRGAKGYMPPDWCPLGEKK